MVPKGMANDSTRNRILMRVSLLAAVVAAVVAYFALGLGEYLELAYLQAVHERAVALVHAQPVVSSVVFFAAYVAITAVSLPGATVMTLAAGAVFGLAWGLVLVSFASTAGATLAMLIARRLLGDYVQRRFAPQLVAVNRGLARDGGFYLFSIRMVPLLPFFVVNLVMGLTTLPVWTFYWVSQLGMLPGTVLYVFAGTRLAALERPSDVLDPALIVALSLLGLFPLLARHLLRWLRRVRGPVAGEP